MLLFFVIGLLCSLTVSSQETYKAGIIDVSSRDVDPRTYAQYIYEAAKTDLDIIVLPAATKVLSENSLQRCELDDYDEIVKTVSKAAKQGEIYVVAHLYEKSHCNNKYEVVRSNLVFDRNGAIVSVYRKPLSADTKCNTTASSIETFTTDFGVTFGVLMEEDLVLHNPDSLGGVKNFVMAESWPSELPFLTGARFASSWTYVTNANLVSAAGIYAGQSGLKSSDGILKIAELGKDGGLDEAIIHPVVKPPRFPAEDLSEYVIKPLDLEASTRGYKQTVCHGKFCCEFYMKARFIGTKQSETNYGLAAFQGVRHFGRNHNIFMQKCAVLACAGNYKRACKIRSENSTNIIFEELTINGNFTRRNSVQFPVILTTSDSVLSTDQFKFVRKPFSNAQKVSISLSDGENLLSFGILGRDFSKDLENEIIKSNESGLTTDIYDYIYNENVQEFFDYVWIRLRILLFVVSIYILEMM